MSTNYVVNVNDAPKLFKNLKTSHQHMRYYMTAICLQSMVTILFQAGPYHFTICFFSLTQTY